MSSSSDCGLETNDVCELSPEELKKRFKQLLLDCEASRQKSHEASMELQVLKMTNAEMSNELSAVTNAYEALGSKFKTTIEKNNQHEAKVKSLDRLVVQLQEEKADMQECIKTLSEQLKNSKSESMLNTGITVDANESLQHLDKIEKLNAQLTETESMLFEVQQANNELTKQCECLAEQNHALHSNYETAKADIEELKNHLEAAQQHAASLANEIQELKNADGSHAKKGNSLFAEVDDQRQKLVKLIQSNRARFNALKAEHQQCPKNMWSVKTEMSQLESRINRYQDEIGCPENQYIKAIKELNSKITVDLQEMFERNNYLKEQISTNSDAWVRSLVKYSSEELNAARRQHMECYLNLRQAEDRHIFRAKELEQVRAELVRLKLKSIQLQWEQFEPNSKYGIQMSGETVEKQTHGEKDETLDNPKDAQQQKCEQPSTNSNPELIELGCSSDTKSCYSNEGISTDSEVDLAVQSIKITESNKETAAVDKSSEHEPQPGPMNISNVIRKKPLVIKKIQLKPRSLNPQ